MPLPSCRLLASSVAFAALSGCVIPGGTPYQPRDPSLPSAHVSISPHSKYIGRKEIEHFGHQDIQCLADGKMQYDDRVLAVWTGGYATESKPVQVALPPGRNYLDYSDTVDKRSCRLTFAVQLEAGHTYALKMEQEHKGWLGPGPCMVRMIDTTTGLPVRLEDRNAQGDDFYPRCDKAGASRPDKAPVAP
ncbi:MAG: hypothetical protein AB1584_12530 [Pseudomonadota bacterium]